MSGPPSWPPIRAPTTAAPTTTPAMVYQRLYQGDRLRVTSDGTVRPCLATEEGVELTEEGKAGVPGAVAATLREAWELKPDASWKGCTEVTARAVSMLKTGG